MARRRKPRLVSEIRFKNGSRMRAFLHATPPTDEPSDVIEVSLMSEGGEEERGWYMNVYDVQNLVILLVDATIAAIEVGVPMLPVEDGET